MHNAQIFVREHHVCGGVLLKINIFDVYMMSEVVWKFFLLLFALLFPKSFVRRLCVLAVQNLCTMHN